MPNRNVKIIGHALDSNAKVRVHVGTGRQFLMNVATVIVNGEERLDPAQVLSKLTGAGVIPASDTWATTSHVILDRDQVPAGIL